MTKLVEKLYTFSGTVNGDPVGKQRGATIEDIKALMACDVHGDTLDKECWTCHDVEMFIIDLDANGQAIHTYRDGDDLYISAAAYERLSE